MRWYAGTAIIEALYRHCVLMESTASIGARFGRPEEAMEWKSLGDGASSCWFLQPYGVGLADSGCHRTLRE
jgi:hypothetical protein